MILIDAGHGGINPSTGEYVTSGKRSPMLPDGSVFYEGVNNRVIANMIHAELKEQGFESMLLVNTWQDVSLGWRVRKANKITKEHPNTILISIHSDAFGDGKKWTSPSGISAFTSKGETKSDKYATIFLEKMFNHFNGIAKFRTDYYRDNDPDKEADFYILRKTKCPAILFELGFHTNLEELQRMMTEDWKQRVVKSIVEGFKEIYGM